MFFWKKKDQSDTNNDMLSLINFPILIKTHNHPLRFCSIKREEGWSCDKCSSDFASDIPSFYCTFCDYDLCQKCLGNHKFNEIKIYGVNSSNFSDIKNDPKKSFKWQKNYPNHNHFLSPIKRENTSSWTCKKCNKEFNNSIFSYYCSLCDYDICFECAENMKETLQNNNIAEKLIEKPKEEDSCGNKSTCDQFSDDDNDDYYVPRKKEPPRIRNNPRNRPKKKPVIYLYPEKEMDICVQLDMDLTKNKFTTIYPKFNKDNNAWDVHAKPNGEIQLKDKKYPYLFWEANSYFTEEMKEGFIVKDENAESFLEEKLKILGLNDKESTDFITFWLPVLLKNKLSLCSFQSQKFFNDMKLNVTPKPDTMIRIFLCIKKIEAPIDIKEQKLEKNERKGFTVIEWGGSDF